MKTSMHISIEESLKNDFKRFAKELGTNPTNLINMFISSSLRSRKVQFESVNDYGITMESFLPEEEKDLLDSTHNSLEKASDLLKNV